MGMQKAEACRCTCDGCGIEFFTNNEKAKEKRILRELLFGAGWVLIGNPPETKGLDKYYCGNCVRERFSEQPKLQDDVIADWPCCKCGKKLYPQKGDLIRIILPPLYVNRMGCVILNEKFGEIVCQECAKKKDGLGEEGK